LRLIEFGVLLGIAVGIAGWLRRRAHLSFWPYILGAGLVSWFAFYRGGLHPALALVPIVPFVPHAARDPGLFVDARRDAHDPLTQFEHWWKGPVQGVLFFFGLANAGVPLLNTGPGTWIVLASILVGKPVGVVLFTVLGTTMGLHRPAHLSWRELIVVGCAAGVGFTVALFFATAAFPAGPLLDQTKMGALFSFAAVPLAGVAAFALSVGRWNRPGANRGRVLPHDRVQENV
jgi:NhaA family Na+:H+ antiporter